MDLNGKVAVVTGSGRGLGLAYAKDLAAAGASVVVNDVDADAATFAAKSIRDAGGAVVAESGNVSRSTTAGKLVERAVAAFGRLDIMVTNAGVLHNTSLCDMSDADFDSVVDVHLRGTFTCARAAAIRMRQQGDGGRIICVGSPAGQLGSSGRSHYAAAKSGILGMVRAWALELADDEITVNAVLPSAATGTTSSMPFLRPYVEAVERDEHLSPFARRALGFGTPRDAAGLVTFLASEVAAGITGQAIGIGGDRVCVWSHPQVVAAAFADGGWSAEALAETWPTTLQPYVQDVGSSLP